MNRIRLDLNDAGFQDSWFELGQAESVRVLACLNKIRRLSWDEIYRMPGLKWEAIESRSSSDGRRLYSFRVTQKSRAIAYRDGDVLRLLLICPDHDSAYR